MIKKLGSSTLALLFIGLTACQASPDSTTGTGELKDPSAPGTGITVRPSNSDWIEEQFLTEIVNIGLERLGYEVEEVRQADYAALNVSIANGDLDYTTGFYRPGHEEFFNNAGGDEKLEVMGTIVMGGGVQGILIDKKTADQYQINNLEQFKDPEIASLFDNDGDGKADLAGCQVGWQCGQAIDHQLDVFGLEDNIEHVQGAYSALIADVLIRHSEGKPVLYYAYIPHWIFSQLKLEEDVTWLEVPFTSLPGDLSSTPESETTVDGKNLGFTLAKQSVLANQKFVDENPAARRLFEAISIPVEDVNTESVLIKDGENSEEEIRRHAEDWVAQNKTLFDSWLEVALTSSN